MTTRKNKRPMGLDDLLESLAMTKVPGRYGLTFQLAVFGHGTLPLTKDPEVPHILSFYHRGVKLSLFSLYGQHFPRYGPIFQITIFGHETSPLAKVPEVADTLPLYPRGFKLSLFLI